MKSTYLKIFAVSALATGAIALVNMEPKTEKAEPTPELLKKPACNPLSASFAKAPLQKADYECPAAETPEQGRPKVRVIEIKGSAP